jgi:tetratricopeptide (TPR) repeat protein
MKNLLSKLFAVLVIAGIMAGCETPDPLIQEAQKNIFTQNYDSALAILDRSIEQNPESGIPYFYKGMTYAEKARTIPQASDRKPTYKNFRENMVTAREKFAAMEEAPSEAEDVTPWILDTWGREHNQAIEFVNNDSLKATVEEPLQVAVAHLENAVIINPDSTLSWDILAQVQYMDGNYAGAIEAMKSTMELKDPPPADDFFKLGVYYSQNDQNDMAIETYTDGLEMYPDSIVLVQNLADAYMQDGQREKSISTIEDLIERDPENPQYRMALATQLLQASTEISDAISANYEAIYDLDRESRNASRSRKEEIGNEIDSLFAANEDLHENMLDLSDEAEEELLAVAEQRPEDDNVYNYLGIAYQNRYAILFEKRNITADNELASEYDKQAKSELRQAMEYYEKAAEINPDNTQYWDVLSRIYVTLDMQEKAEEALEKAGM